MLALPLPPYSLLPICLLYFTRGVPPAILEFMSIQVQQTPNPNARKFVLADHRFAGSRNFDSVQSAAADPVAARLFALPGVYNVLMAQDFITVNKRPEVAWDELEAAVIAVLVETVDVSPLTSARTKPDSSG